MTAPAPAWWSPEAGFAFAPAWTGPDAGPAAKAQARPAPRVCVVGVAGQVERNAARQAIRQAVRAALCTLFGVDAGAIGLHAVSAQAPYAVVRTGAADDTHAGADTAGRRVALAFSHDEALSIAAIGLDCAVGVDVMRIVDIPEWQALARDYLGPDAADTLAGLNAGERPVALARAWSEREARLKCLGRPLGEWRADDEAGLEACRCLALALPDGYVGCLAVADAASG